MQRDPNALTGSVFDLVVVGGGVSGAATAWDAALRGLDVALLEKADFGGATSAASSKLIHGGIRYLQQGHAHLVRKSVRERSAWLRIAPHLVHPIPFLIPTYGHGLRGKEILRAGTLAYDLLTRNRNAVADPAKRIPACRALGRDAVRELAPEVPEAGLTGGVVYHDAQLHVAERATLALVRSAAARGAVVVNHVEARGLLRDGRRVIGIEAHDHRNGTDLEVRGRVVVRLTGPWGSSLEHGAANVAGERLTLAKGVHVLVPEVNARVALAVGTRAPNESLINRGGRHVFLIPWQGHTLIGTTHVPFDGTPDEVGVSETDVVDFLDDIRAALPGLPLERGDVRNAYAGLYPLLASEAKTGMFQAPRDYRIFDHAPLEGTEGMLTVLGARFTTARRLAEATVDAVATKLGRGLRPCATEHTRLVGGEIDDSTAFFAREASAIRARHGDAVAGDLLRTHGTEHEAVAALAAADPALDQRLSDSRPTLGAAVAFAAREEMAETLADVVFHRTTLGQLGHPGDSALERTTAILAREHGWDEARQRSELADVRRRFAALPIVSAPEPPR